VLTSPSLWIPASEACLPRTLNYAIDGKVAVHHLVSVAEIQLPVSIVDAQRAAVGPLCPWKLLCRASLSSPELRDLVPQQMTESGEKLGVFDG